MVLPCKNQISIIKSSALSLATPVTPLSSEKAKSIRYDNWMFHALIQRVHSRA